MASRETTTMIDVDASLKSPTRIQTTRSTEDRGKRRLSSRLHDHRSSKSMEDSVANISIQLSVDDSNFNIALEDKKKSKERHSSKEVVDSAPSELRRQKTLPNVTSPLEPPKTPSRLERAVTSTVAMLSSSPRHTSSADRRNNESRESKKHSSKSKEMNGGIGEEENHVAAPVSFIHVLSPTASPTARKSSRRSLASIPTSLLTPLGKDKTSRLQRSLTSPKKELKQSFENGLSHGPIESEKTSKAPKSPSKRHSRKIVQLDNERGTVSPRKNNDDTKYAQHNSIRANGVDDHVNNSKEPRKRQHRHGTKEEHDDDDNHNHNDARRGSDDDDVVREGNHHRRSHRRNSNDKMEKATRRHSNDKVERAARRNSNDKEDEARKSTRRKSRENLLQDEEVAAFLKILEGASADEFKANVIGTGTSSSPEENSKKTISASANGVTKKEKEKEKSTSPDGAKSKKKNIPQKERKSKKKTKNRDMNNSRDSFDYIEDDLDDDDDDIGGYVDKRIIQPTNVKKSISRMDSFDMNKSIDFDGIDSESDSERGAMDYLKQPAHRNPVHKEDTENNSSDRGRRQSVSCLSRSSSVSRGRRDRSVSRSRDLSLKPKRNITKKLDDDDCEKSCSTTTAASSSDISAALQKPKDGKSLNLTRSDSPEKFSKNPDMDSSIRGRRQSLAVWREQGKSAASVSADRRKSERIRVKSSLTLSPTSPRRKKNGESEDSSINKNTDGKTMATTAEGDEELVKSKKGDDELKKKQILQASRHGPVRASRIRGLVDEDELDTGNLLASLPMEGECNEDGTNSNNASKQLVGGYLPSSLTGHASLSSGLDSSRHKRQSSLCAALFLDSQRTSGGTDTRNDDNSDSDCDNDDSRKNSISTSSYLPGNLGNSQQQQSKQQKNSKMDFEKTANTSLSAMFSKHSSSKGSKLSSSASVQSASSFSLSGSRPMSSSNHNHGNNDSDPIESLLKSRRLRADSVSRPRPTALVKDEEKKKKSLFGGGKKDKS